MDLAWMAWTWPTAVFFICIVTALIAMTVWDLKVAQTERAGVLGILTTRGDRLFISLLGSGWIHLIWLGLVGPQLWIASILSVVYAICVFRWV
jgi:predicted small integral membrane protein